MQKICKKILYFIGSLVIAFLCFLIYYFTVGEHIDCRIMIERRREADGVYIKGSLEKCDKLGYNMNGFRGVEFEEMKDPILLESLPELKRTIGHIYQDKYSN